MISCSSILSRDRAKGSSWEKAGRAKRIREKRQRNFFHFLTSFPEAW